MKKLILLALLLGGLPTFAQKTFEVYNYTAYTVQLADIATKVATGTYPEFHSKPSGLISIPPGGSYTLVNTANLYRFPFLSPSSSPTIPTWERLNSASPPTTYLPSATAWPLGTSQVFKELFFFVGGAYQNISVTSPSLPLQSGGWQADYVEDNPAPNVWFYTIVIY